MGKKKRGEKEDLNGKKKETIYTNKSELEKNYKKLTGQRINRLRKPRRTGVFTRLELVTPR
jgi:ABC-type phosphate transport system auxiliary subunit